MKLEITFKSGAQVAVDVTEFSTGKSVIDQELTKLSWTTPEDWTRKLHTVKLDEIVCLVAVDDD